MLTLSLGSGSAVPASAAALALSVPLTLIDPSSSPADITPERRSTHRFIVTFERNTLRSTPLTPSPFGFLEGGAFCVAACLVLRKRSIPSACTTVVCGSPCASKSSLPCQSVILTHLSVQRRCSLST